MSEEFGDLVRLERVSRNLRFGGLARLLLDRDATSRQISRMARRLVDIERGGRRDKRLVAQLVRVLELDVGVVSDVLTAERAQELERWHAWLTAAVDPVMHFRAIPGVWITKKLAEVSTADALTIASEFARDKRLIVCLAVDHGLSVWFDQKGREYARVEAAPGQLPTPRMMVRNHPFVLESER